MSKEREALKLALEALDCIYSPLHVREIEKVGNAMKAIKKVLEQPPEERNFCPRCGKRAGKNAWDVHTCSLPEEEKIASFQEVDGGDLLDGIEKLRALRDSDWAQSRDIDGEIRALRGHDDRTTPPQREWVGLTDEERLEAAEIDGADEWFWKVCKAIEAKLKEKNLETRTGAT